RDPAVRGGTVVVDLPGSEKICDELIRRKFVVDWRAPSTSVLGTPLKRGIRISPHFYNSDEECDAVAEEIAKLRGKVGQSPRRWGRPTPSGPRAAPTSSARRSSTSPAARSRAATATTPSSRRP